MKNKILNLQFNFFFYFLILSDIIVMELILKHLIICSNNNYLLFAEDILSLKYKNIVSANSFKLKKTQLTFIVQNMYSETDRFLI